MWKEDNKPVAASFYSHTGSHHVYGKQHGESFHSSLPETGITVSLELSETAPTIQKLQNILSEDVVDAPWSAKWQEELIRNKDPQFLLELYQGRCTKANHPGKTAIQVHVYLKHVLIKALQLALTRQYSKSLHSNRCWIYLVNAKEIELPIHHLSRPKHFHRTERAP